MSEIVLHARKNSEVYKKKKKKKKKKTTKTSTMTRMQPTQFLKDNRKKPTFKMK